SGSFFHAQLLSFLRLVDARRLVSHWQASPQRPDNRSAAKCSACSGFRLSPTERQCTAARDGTWVRFGRSGGVPCPEREEPGKCAAGWWHLVPGSCLHSPLGRNL